MNKYQLAFAVAIYKMQNRLTTIDAEVSHTPFSTLQAIRMRESFLKINALQPKNRMNRTWEYVLVGESVFYSLSGSGATITDICDQCKVSYSVAIGNLFE